MIGQLQPALTDSVPGARIDVRQLQTNPRRLPCRTSRRRPRRHQRARRSQQTSPRSAISSRVRSRHPPSVPASARVRNDWGQEGQVTLKVDPDRANMPASPTGRRAISAAALSGTAVTTLARRSANPGRRAPARERTRAALRCSTTSMSIPPHPRIQSPAAAKSRRIENILQTQRIRHLEHFRTISVQAFPRPAFSLRKSSTRPRPSCAVQARSRPAIASSSAASKPSSSKDSSIWHRHGDLDRS